MQTGVDSQRIDLTIVGMHCPGCASSVAKALRGVPGVAAAAMTSNSLTVVLNSLRLRDRRRYRQPTGARSA